MFKYAGPILRAVVGRVILRNMILLGFMGALLFASHSGYAQFWGDIVAMSPNIPCKSETYNNNPAVCIGWVECDNPPLIERQIAIHVVEDYQCPNGVAVKHTAEAKAAIGETTVGAYRTTQNAFTQGVVHDRSEFVNCTGPPTLVNDDTYEQECGDGGGGGGDDGGGGGGGDDPCNGDIYCGDPCDNGGYYKLYCTQACEVECWGDYDCYGNCMFEYQVCDPEVCHGLCY